MEVSGRVKPQVDPLFSITFSVSKNISLNRVGLPTSVPQKLKIKLITDLISIRVHLP
ncbi:hypothetical protein Hanom_Chr14g01300871 [Helianthus anomalus]